ncbi:biotin carboxyl carrier protein of acetyl-CoA carboxylase 1, chloroplastic-like [Magnolia sinica]|uniref:biotin carboxyl carrier protein of acetyl-CoA carboxylase 1, chloroplastic-like n=1 Tax=Magnolia sinica TaxID=86752 RepID=UPI00265AAC61|nr:biotin carboxyl carrier protein of acetyl-CoA carboxylase 1, chloroplastic-like [Magnolia sinica]
MASSLPAAAPIVIKATSSSFSSQRQSGHHSKLCFRLSSKPKLLFSSKGLRTNWNRSCITKAKLSKVPIDGSSNAAPAPDTNSEVPTLEGKDDEPANGLSPVASEASIAEFMTQVASLVKLVDSRDIIELQLKQLDCELIIRKKEALPQQSVQAPVVMMQPPSPQSAMPSHFPPAQPAAPVAPAGPAPSSAPALVPPPAAKSTKSSLPPLKCPMAGTFYRSPGPGEPPFVKVGDKVKKGQVLCLIEAMKLMNEIEADQSGTVIEVLVDDAKPVSVDTPLFVIEP